MAIGVAALSFAQVQMETGQAPKKRIALFSLTLHFQELVIRIRIIKDRIQPERAALITGTLICSYMVTCT